MSSVAPDLIQRVSLPEGASGSWRVKKVVISPEMAAFQNLRMSLKPMVLPGREILPGEYTMLYDGPSLQMSDTPAEMKDHEKFVVKARGSVLITGLGIGMVVEACLRKPEVSHVYVVEKSRDVVRLVAPTYVGRYHDRLTVYWADAYEWRPPHGLRFDAIWHDIWPSLDAMNLEQMKKIKRRYRKRLTPEGFQACWAEDECRKLRSMERRIQRDLRRRWYG